MCKRNEYENFCQYLSKYERNKISYVRKELQETYGNNTDMYRMIKAEAQEYDSAQNLQILISIAVFSITAINILNNITASIVGESYDLFNMIYLFVLGIILVVILVWDLRHFSMRRWRKYVLEVIDDLIEESKVRNKDGK